MQDLIIGETYREDRSSDSEAPVYLRGQQVAYLHGECRNEGSFLHPRYRIYAYRVELIEEDKEFLFESRGDAIKWLRQYFDA